MTSEGGNFTFAWRPDDSEGAGIFSEGEIMHSAGGVLNTGDGMAFQKGGIILC